MTSGCGGEIRKQIDEICNRVFDQLGSAHSEKVYQKAIQAELNARSLLTMSEVCVPVQYVTIHGETVTVGDSYIDLLIVPWQAVIEVKHLTKSCTDTTQLQKYLDISKGRSRGFLVTFPKANAIEKSFTKVSIQEINCNEIV